MSKYIRENAGKMNKTFWSTVPFWIIGTMVIQLTQYEDIGILIFLFPSTVAAATIVVPAVYKLPKTFLLALADLIDNLNGY